MAKREDVVQEVKRVFSDLNGLTARLKALETKDKVEMMSAATEHVAFSEPLDPHRGHADVKEHELITDITSGARDRALNDGIRGLEKIELGRENELTPSEELGLEAIILIEGRPALLIQNGSFFPPPTEWRSLEKQRAAIESTIARVARIEVSGHPSFEWLGTGFLIDERRILTNRHVAAEFARQVEKGFEFRTSMGAAADFLEELGSTKSLEFRISRVIGIHHELDMAVLEIDPDSADGALPSPLPLASAEPNAIAGRDVYVIGYPAWDTRNGIEPMRAIFSDVYNVKRLQPGKAGDLSQTILRHDCSTLGGNSGSPVIDLETHQVLGLHYGGRFLEGNSSVPLWQVASDQLLAGANFQ